MRPAALAGLAAALIVSHARAADPTPYLAVVDTEVKLRAGPNDTFPDTGTLTRGSQVIVEREEGSGWLAVTAPKGSVSWIAASFVEDLHPDRPTPKSGLVEHEGEVTLAAGKVDLAQPLNVRREKVPQGTIVKIIGPLAEFNGRKWYPIEPPAGDVRYLPRTAVKYDKPANNNFAVRVTEHTGPALASGPSAPGAGPLATIPGPGGVTPAGAGVTASKPAVNHPLWTQAEIAEREGRLADAEKAYFDLAALMNGAGGDHDIANLCYTRIHALREKKRTGGAPPLATSVLQPPPKEERPVRPGAPQAIPTGTKPNTNITPPTDSGDGRPQWSGIGTLLPTGVTPDGSGSPAYALVTASGDTKVYVIAGPGVDLKKLARKRVDVYGVPQSKPGLSRPYVIATAVEPAQ